MRVLLVALVALAACSSDPAPSRACTPGAQVACACVGGARGAQVCAADGSGLGACTCPDAGPVPDVQGHVDAGEDAAPEVSVDAAEVSVDVPGDQGPETPTPCPDSDGDGHRAASCGGDDCDDTNREIRPGATEVCDGIDSNCDGVADGYPDGRTDPIAAAWCSMRSSGSDFTCDLPSWSPSQLRCSPGPAGARAWCTWIRNGMVYVAASDSSSTWCPRP